MYPNNPDVEENALLSDLMKGNKEAFTVLYNKYSARLYTNIRRLVKCDETSKEILQDLFLKIWEAREQIDPSRSFKSYLFKIAENLVYDHFRKAARDKKLGDYLISSSALFYSHSEETVIYDESLHFIRKAIDLLPPARKQIYTLCKMEGKSYEEIASLLRISTSTVSDHMVKANRAIKKYLQLHADLVISFLLVSIL
ncbi:RNA polymerase sigma-H factor [Dyadobacter sp. CECT 9275]|uniref:RNA polymerase sigma-H factor n=1 Tax=Dyadobacter helix TaxID=2822344 RepID=A0A916JJU7_9BACT|nr:RNA polymerase sigma-70 factor [Dyadobacter sp. CECT 9275]CAG5018133.1 RNA polymerase sigma-H factor [Dyadobacter sp. CECT 9275]